MNNYDLFKDSFKEVFACYVNVIVSIDGQCPAECVDNQFLFSRDLQGVFGE